MADAKALLKLLQQLTGQDASLPAENAHAVAELVVEGLRSGVGCDQFNEALLLLGYDRVNTSFFQYLVNQSVTYVPGSALTTFEQLADGVNQFRKLALLFFGNVKYAFKNLSRDSGKLADWVADLDPRGITSYTQRHSPLRPIEPIRGEDTYYLGYLIAREIRQRLEQNPADEAARADEAQRVKVIEIGKRNQEAYLASDHLDVYVATSMRARHEYLFVNEFCSQIFGDKTLAKLKLRWFDPTQAYCKSRIDKGLAEALMLKRAKCTLYFVQEADTLGKDSELASTLAQGKPVIAFVPEVDDDYAETLLAKLPAIYPGRDERTLVLEQLQLFDSSIAWTQPSVRRWIDDPGSFERKEAVALLLDRIRKQYDSRARTLGEDHPLGIQVNLRTGVANGVLVVRTVEQCAELLRQVLTSTVQFDLESEVQEGLEYWFLKEKVSGCVFRVMTGDAMLTNTFWNFYLRPTD